jgi:cytochrome c oxidase subunit 4
MSDDHAAEIDRHVRVYITVFVALMGLTVVTVAANFLLHLSVAGTIALALFIASIKGALVACYFMHLISERKLIYWVLGFTVFNFLGMLLIPILTESDKIRY